MKIILTILLFAFSLFFSQEKDTIVVSLNNDGDFTSVQEAINNSPSFPYKRKIILIKNGLYKEKIKLHEWNTNLTLLGEDKNKTILSYDDNFKKINLGRNSTFFTPTLLVEGNDAVLKNLCIENTSGDVGQAIALSIVGKRVAVINCKILGNQDTLYLGGEGKNYFKNCYIEGTTDFIFGNANAFFENCDIYSKKDSYITAASTPENTDYGFVFYNCKLIANSGISKVYLGRPWRIFAKTVFISCDLGSHILPEGWDNWNKKEAEKNSFYAEYGNYGSGSNTKNRVKWSHQLSKTQIKKYKKEIILKDPQNPTWYENF